MGEPGTEEVRTCRNNGRTPCDGSPDFDVIYVTHGAVFERHPVCWRHGLDETDAASKAASIAEAHMVSPGANA